MTDVLNEEIFEIKKRIIELEASLQDQQSQIDKKCLQIKEVRQELERNDELILMMKKD
jgi:oligoendopeptidase F